MTKEQEEIFQMLKSFGEQKQVQMEHEMANMARIDRMMYEQHIKAGFTPKQAMQIVTDVLKSALSQPVKR